MSSYQVKKLYEEALRIHPRYIQVMLERAKLHAMLGDEASEKLDLITAADMGDAEAHFHLGLNAMTTWGSEGCVDAEWHFRKALETEPMDRRYGTSRPFAFSSIC